MKRQVKHHIQRLKKRRIRLVFALLFIPILLFSYIVIHQTKAQNEYSKKREEPIRIEHHNTIENTTPPPITHRFSNIGEADKALRIPVLMYHDVKDIPASSDGNIITKDQFEAQLRYLKDHGFTTLTVAEFIDAYNNKINIPKKSVLLTFDDGFQSIKTIVSPLLKQYDMHATSFIIGSYIDRPQWHLTQDDIKTLQENNSHIDFESHTFDLHKDGKAKGIINETSPQAIAADNQKLEAIIGHKTNILCYPFGAFSTNAFEGLKNAHIPFGFAIKSGNTSWVYLNSTHTTAQKEVQNPLALPRIRISPEISIPAFAKIITDN